MKIITSKVLNRLSTNSRSLQHLQFDGCGLCSWEMYSIAGNFYNLQLFSVRDCKDLDDNSLVLFIEHCPLLTHLDISNCTMLTSITILALSKYSHKLRKLYVSNIECSTCISEYSLMKVLENCTELTDMSVGTTLTMDSLVEKACENADKLIMSPNKDKNKMTVSFRSNRHYSRIVDISTLLVLHPNIDTMPFTTICKSKYQ